MTSTNNRGSAANRSIGKLTPDDASLQREPMSSENVTKVEEELLQQRLMSLLQEQQLRPTTVYKLTVHGARNTRRSFLDPIVRPVVDNCSTSSTLGEVLYHLKKATSTLDQLEIFQPDPEVFLSSPDQSDPNSSPTDINVDVRLRELGRLRLKTGTDVGNGEGSAYGSLLWRNIFGGAEMLSVNASAGTRTRSAYSTTLSIPVPTNPNIRVAIDGFASATEKPWASHEEMQRGGNLRLSWISEESDLHAVEYTGMWRQITGLREKASPTVRADAGDSFKSSIRHTFQRDRRNNRHLPQAGYLFRSALEFAGIGPLGGDVAFAKGDFDMGGALPISLPGFEGPTGMSIGGGLRFGALYPLSSGYSFGSRAIPSKICDRFQLGGPTDVRGFKLGGLGPHDGNDAVGGDLFAAGSVNLLLPLPYKGPESGLRLQLFANGGRLVALRNKGKSRESAGKGMSATAVRDGMFNALGDLLGSAPSLAAGFGLVYGHPMARFELNFSLPIVLRRGEQSTKGLQVGVGINFL